MASAMSPFRNKIWCVICDCFGLNVVPRNRDGFVELCLQRESPCSALSSLFSHVIVEAVDRAYTARNN